MPRKDYCDITRNRKSKLFQTLGKNNIKKNKDNKSFEVRNLFKEEKYKQKGYNKGKICFII